MRNTPPATSHEYQIRDDQNLLSRTDLKGRITYAAPAFVEVSGYSHAELIGAPHSLVRHPDMPAAAFADLWQTIQRGEIWTGVVKNRRKNGDFYWVRANVVPIIENGELQGYASVRVRPTEEERRLAERTYARLRDGDSRGVRLGNGQILRRGLAGWLQRLNPSNLKTRLNGMIALNLLLLCITATLSYLGYVQTSADIQQLLGSEQTAFTTGVLNQMQAKQQQLLGAQLLLMLLVGGLMLGVGTLILRHFLRQLREAMTFAMQIASGNLSGNPPPRSRSEIGRLLDMLAIMRQSLGNIVTDVNRSLDVVKPAAQSIADGNEDLSARTELQASALQQTAASMEQLTATVQQNADNARQASKLTETASTEVKQTGEAMGRVVQSMRRINDGSEQITEIIRVIDSIAFQTNILALNASVEAARAGEHGRGFAVVAGEVRNLASRSAGAAQEVRQLIESSHQEILGGGEQVKQAEAAIERVVSAVLKLNDIMGEISAASTEQGHGIEQVNAAIAQMDEAVQRNAALVQGSAQAAGDMELHVGELGNAISVLRLGGQGREQVSREQRFHAHRARQQPAAAPHTHTQRPRDSAAELPAEADDWQTF